MAHKFIIHKKVEKEVVSALRGDQHEVHFAAGLDQDIQSNDLCRKANQEDYILLTGDEDYAWDLFRHKQITSGLIHINVQEDNPTAKAKVVLDAILKKDKELKGAFTTISNGLVEQKELKQP